MSGTPAEQAAAVRRGAGLFRLERGLVAVEGGDRRRWLDGMVSNDVAALAPGPERSGCYALLLSRKGRIVADLNVLLREDALWLETETAAVAPVLATLERYVIADDVVLRDRSGEFDRLGLEGPAAAAVLEAALGDPPGLAPQAWRPVRLAGQEALLAAFGWSGQGGYQLFAPGGAGEAVAAALLAAGAPAGLVEAGPEALEILRVEAGVPRLGAELDDEVFPAEARLERAVSDTKGCYTGQEIVARIRSRGQVRHHLVGVRFAQGEPPAVGEEIHVEGRRSGEVTSACRSPAAGAIALGYVRVEHETPGTEVTVGGRPAQVSALPFPELALG